jgi:hypothetical protein
MLPAVTTTAKLRDKQLQGEALGIVPENLQGANASL